MKSRWLHALSTPPPSASKPCSGFTTALAVALLGAFVGAGLWAVASHTNSHHYAARGRMAALVSAAAALVIGAGPGLVNFFQHLGSTAK